MVKGESGGYFDRLVPSHWLCPGMPPLTAFGPLAAPVGPLRCSRPPLALARVTHMHSAAHPRHSGAPGGLQRASRPCLSCHCRPFVGDSVHRIVKMDAFKTRGTNYSRRTLSPRPTVRRPAAERRASGPTSARCFPDCTPAACAIPIPAPIFGRIFALCASPRPRLCSQF